MNAYLGFLKRRFLWAVAGLVMSISYTWMWGDWFVRTMLAVTGLSDAEVGTGSLTAGEWLGLVAGSLVVMSPVVAGFLAFVVAWVGWPGRPRPRNPRRLATIGMGLGIAVTAFLLAGLMGNYWPVSSWRDGTRSLAGAANLDLANSAWVGDMYFGLLMALIGLYAVVMFCAVFMPQEIDPLDTERTPVRDAPPAVVEYADAEEYQASYRSPWDLEEERKAEQQARSAAASSDFTPRNGEELAVTGIWWPFAAGAAVVVLSLIAAVWPHLA